MSDLRLKAMDYALQARNGPDEDIVELAERIHSFLADQNERKPLSMEQGPFAHPGRIRSPNEEEMAWAIREQVRNDAQPPPIPASAVVPPFGPEVPRSITMGGDFGPPDPPFDYDNEKTRLIRSTQESNS